MQRMFYTPAEIEMKVQCYHYRDNTTRVVDAEGNTTVRTNQDKVNTHSASQKFCYFTWRDISGQFLLDTSDQIYDPRKAFVKLYLDLKIKFAKDGTKEDYEYQVRSFKCQHMRDAH